MYILLGGVDKVAHLYYIVNPGTYSSFDPIGFHCPGMGREQAESTFVWYNYSPLLPENIALYIAFEAKKKAETAGGVGETTDGWIIEEGGVYEIEQETISNLKEIYRLKQESIGKAMFGKEINELQISKKEVQY